MAKTFRHQHLYHLPQHFGTAVIEHAFGLGIHHFNPATRIDHDHGIRRRFDDAAKTLFESLTLGHILDYFAIAL